VDALAKDAHALLAALDGQELSPGVAQAAALLATVTGQDLEQDAAGVFRIARRATRRKNCWTIAEHAGDATPDGMQHL
jgi:hypothetical protein